MAFYLVQQWWVVAGPEDPLAMGDANRMPSQQGGERGAGSPQAYGELGMGSSSIGRGGTFLSQNQYYMQPGASQLPNRNEAAQLMSHYTQQNTPTTVGQESERSLSMGAMASTLPNYRPSTSTNQSSVGSNMQRLSPGVLPSQIHHQQQQQHHQQQQQPPHQQHQGPSAVSQYTSQHISSNPAGYPPHFLSPLHNAQPSGTGSSPFLLHQSLHQARGGLASPMQQSFTNQSFHPGQHAASSQYMYYPAMYGGINPSQGYGGVPRQQMDGNLHNLGGSYPSMGGGLQGVQAHGLGPVGRAANTSDMAKRPNTSSTAGAIPAAPRGPPRKPKQSGHALWVGNLPPGANVSDLKDHFSKDATKDIESVFLISKSNCAFVNYRSETACAAAMSRFHESRFQGVRLVCRLRRTPTATGSSSVPTGPSALSPSTQQSQTAVEAINQNREVSSKAEESMRQLDGASKINDKYFVVKSLTLEDLELSARNGIWATQSHNEAALNRAFEMVDNVYLIFSANKSGEYFGYARMASPINEEVAKDLEWKPRAEVVIDESDLPRAIPTAATETAPKGQIIDDSARGTIFWEADALELEGASPIDGSSGEEGDGNKVNNEDEEQTPEVQAFGQPFKIEWVSTNRLPFYRTRGLRNPWNANREVKIARDGTELETSVGRRLVEMFHRSAPASSQQSMSTSLPAPIGYPGSRPF